MMATNQQIIDKLDHLYDITDKRTERLDRKLDALGKTTTRILTLQESVEEYRKRRDKNDKNKFDQEESAKSKKVWRMLGAVALSFLMLIALLFVSALLGIPMPRIGELIGEILGGLR